MNETTPSPIESKEKPKGELWVVDDNGYPFLPLIEAKTGLVCRQYFRGIDALNELTKRAKEGKEIPKIIFMDGILAGDRPAFARGKDIIPRIRRMAIPQPKIVAFSSDHAENEKMLEVGAEVVISKSGDFLEVVSDIEELLK